jgi:lysophospholipase L1-like esterase
MIFLCLGDSLTAGYPGYDPAHNGIALGYGNIQSQYEYWLKLLCLEHLERNLGSIDDDIVNNLLFVNKGIPGELTSDLLRRIGIDLLNYKPKPEYSIIIGGTNDLGWNIPNENIFKNIKKLHSLSRETNIKSIGALIPPIRMEQSIKSYNDRKIALNNALKTYFKEIEIPYADLYSKMMDDEENLMKKYAYADGLHFSIDGYKCMGEIIFEDVIKKIIEDNYF